MPQACTTPACSAPSCQHVVNCLIQFVAALHRCLKLLRGSSSLQLGDEEGGGMLRARTMTMESHNTVSWVDCHLQASAASMEASPGQRLRCSQHVSAAPASLRTA